LLGFAVEPVQVFARYREMNRVAGVRRGQRGIHAQREHGLAQAAMDQALGAEGLVVLPTGAAPGA